MPTEDKTDKEKLLQLLRETVAKDTALREKYQMGDKFRFIRDRLQALLNRTEENIKTMQAQEEKSKDAMSAEETPVYVYIYNAQGLVLQTWNKLLLPQVFYEYSVNRPIYNDRHAIETYIRGRPNRAQHGFLTVAVKKTDIIQQAPNEITKDNIGNTLIRVKEGSLHANKLISFTHNENNYEVDESGNLKLIKVS